MKHPAIVTTIADPKGQGRLKVHLSHAGGESPWALPCVPFAGPGYGLFCLPQVGDMVWVEQSAQGQWVYVGFFWTARNQKPAAGSSSVRTFRTPAGHELIFDESGDLTIGHSAGHSVVLRANGDIDVIPGEGVVNLGGAGTEALLKGETFQARMNALIEAFASHTHVYIDSVGSSGTPTPKSTQAPVTAPSTSPATDLCEKVRGQ